jgi:hypothetical protein
VLAGKRAGEPWAHVAAIASKHLDGMTLSPGCGGRLPIDPRRASLTPMRTRSLGVFGALVASALLVTPRSDAQEAPPPAPPAAAPTYIPPPAAPTYFPPPAPAPVAAPVAPAPPVPVAPVGPAVLDYDDGMAIPAGYHLVTRSQPEYTWGGFAVFGLSYGTAVYVASIVTSISSSSDNKKANVLFVPVAGPFLGISAFKSSGAGTFWLATWGLAQAGGLVAMIYGLTTPKKSLWRNDIVGKLDVTPFVAGVAGGPGLTLSGAF